MQSPQPRPAAFIDRDGVINRDHGYVSSWDEFELLPGVVDALTTLQSLGFALVVVTNQSGIGRGRYDEAQFQALTTTMTEFFADRGVVLTGTYFCPHHPTAARGAYLRICECRKPAPGMLLQAARDHQLDLAASIMVGDKPSDIAAGRAAGVARCYQVTQGPYENNSVPVASLGEVADLEQRRVGSDT